MPVDVILDAPTNLGLKPPAEGCVPGADKAPAALRSAGLHAALRSQGLQEAGVVLAGRYEPTHVAGTVRNQRAIVEHARRLARAVGEQLDAGRRPLVLGGDCSTLVGCSLALRERGRYGLVHIDGHTDFRHPGNSDGVANLAGEDLAAAVGLHLPEISDIDRRSPYVRPEEVAHIGCREDDAHLAECRSVLGQTVTASEWSQDPAAAGEAVLRPATRPGLEGFWVHVDVDVLDPSWMPAVDSPDPGGVGPEELVDLLKRLWPRCTGMTVGILDPDLDPSGDCARLVADIILRATGTAPSRVTGAPAS